MTVLTSVPSVEALLDELRGARGLGGRGHERVALVRRRALEGALQRRQREGEHDPRGEDHPPRASPRRELRQPVHRSLSGASGPPCRVACPGCLSFSVASSCAVPGQRALDRRARRRVSPWRDPRSPQATVRLASVVLLSLSRLAVALLTVRLTVPRSTDWQLTRTAKRPLRSAERVAQPRGHRPRARRTAPGAAVDGACRIVGATDRDRDA